MIRNDYEEIGASIGRLVQEKQAAYGDSFNRACEILRVLYPEGVTPDKYRDFLAVTRVIDKLFRIATDKDAFGESPWRDVAGYSLLSVSHKEDGSAVELTTPVDDNGTPGIGSELAKELEASGVLTQEVDFDIKRPATTTVVQNDVEA